MKNKKKILIIFVSVMLLACLGSVLGVTLSRWSSGEGDSTVAPQVGVTDWNVYAKYMTADSYSDGARLTGFKQAAAIEDVVLPKSIDVEQDDGTTKSLTVRAVSNSLYADTTDKSIPATLTIPNTITSIEAGAFSGMTRLTTVTFESGSECVIGAGAFMGSNAVTEFIVGADSNITFGTNTLTSDKIEDFKMYVGLPSSTTITLITFKE